jgi:hypothetical protein
MSLLSIVKRSQRDRLQPVPSTRLVYWKNVIPSEAWNLLFFSARLRVLCASALSLILYFFISVLLYFVSVKPRQAAA